MTRNVRKFFFAFRFTGFFNGKAYSGLSAKV